MFISYPLLSFCREFFLALNGSRLPIHISQGCFKFSVKTHSPGPCWPLTSRPVNIILWLTCWHSMRCIFIWLSICEPYPEKAECLCTEDVLGDRSVLEGQALWMENGSLLSRSSYLSGSDKQLTISGGRGDCWEKGCLRQIEAASGEVPWEGDVSVDVSQVSGAEVEKGRARRGI